MTTKFFIKFIFPCVLLLGCEVAHASFSNLSRNDYFPLHSTLDPHAYLLTRTKEQMHDRTDDGEMLDRFCLSISPFGQNADIGKDLCNAESELGNLNARWSMIGMLMGGVPAGQSFAPTLVTAQTNLFPGLAVPIYQPSAIDPDEKFGFFEFPSTYRKRGLRFDAQVGLWGGFGVGINGGGSDINFRVCKRVNRTTGATVPCNKNDALTETTVDKYLMCKLDDIAKEIGLNLENFHKSSFEDTTIYLFWRDAFQVCEDKEYGWEQFLVIPHFNVAFIAPSGNEKDPAHAFGIQFGNNGHKAVGFKGGIDLDFTATIELGWEVGFVHFWDHSFKDYFVPTSDLQQGIFPFKTNVSISPGFNWHFGLHMQAHHFLEHLSFYGQWVVMEHMNDKINVLSGNSTSANCCDTGCNGGGDSAFQPHVLERRSGFKAQVFNSALNYDISPNIGLGIMWQAPLSQRNAFRSSTLMFGLNFIF